MIYAMDTCFGMGTPEVISYPLDQRCRMLADLGYDATYLTLSNEVEAQQVEDVAKHAERHGLTVAAVYLMPDLASEDFGPSLSTAAAEVIAALPEGTDLEIAIRHTEHADRLSDPAFDDLAVDALAPYVEAMADKPGSGRVLLYPHFSFWLEKFADACRVVKQFEQRHGKSDLGTVFCGIHWLIADKQSVPEMIEAGADCLGAVNLSGLTMPGEVAGVAVHPLDTGQMDNFGVLLTLQQAGYTGRIGLQGYGMGGDVQLNLRRSMDWIKDAQQRVEQWA